MNHEPYQSWLLDPESLPPDQAGELQSHLFNCPECTRLRANWQGVQQLIAEDEEIPVPAGFTARWQASLPDRIARRKAAQIRKMLYLLGGGILLVSLGFLVFVTVTSSPAELVHRLIQLITGVGSTLNQGQNFFLYLTRQAPLPLLLFIGLALSSWIVLLSATWIFTFLRFSIKGEDNQ